MIPRVPPDLTDHRVLIKVWENDCNCVWNDDDYFGSNNLYWDDREVDYPVPATNPNAMFKFDWIPRDPSVLTSIAAPDVYVENNFSEYVEVRLLDQYGYGLTGYVGSWVSDDPSVATIQSAGGRKGKVTAGSAVGQTDYHATVSGVTGTGTIHVVDRIEDGCYPALYC